jgi:hypothetical protein
MKTPPLFQCLPQIVPCFAVRYFPLAQTRAFRGGPDLKESHQGFRKTSAYRVYRLDAGRSCAPTQRPGRIYCRRPAGPALPGRAAAPTAPPKPFAIYDSPIMPVGGPVHPPSHSIPSQS